MRTTCTQHTLYLLIRFDDDPAKHMPPLSGMPRTLRLDFIVSTAKDCIDLQAETSTVFDDIDSKDDRDMQQ